MARSSSAAPHCIPSPASLRSRLLRALREKDGSTLIEAAFVLPAFTFLLFGIFEFSMALTCFCSATYAARAGARYASTHGAASLLPASSTDIQNVVLANLYLPGIKNFNIANIAVSNVNGSGYVPGNYMGDAVKVQIQWSQSINLVAYHKTFSVSTQAYRIITR